MAHSNAADAAGRVSRCGWRTGMLAVGLILPRPMDFVKELRTFGAVEKKVLANYHDIMGKARRGETQDKATAGRIRAEVLRLSESERQTLAVYKGLPSRQQVFLTALIQYIDSEQHAWIKLAQNFELHNTGLLRESLREQIGSAAQASGNDAEFTICFFGD